MQAQTSAIRSEMRSAFLRMSRSPSSVVKTATQVNHVRGPERRTLEDVRVAMLRVGDMPPEPPTLRGRIGARLVKIVRRSLFWVTPQIRRVHLLFVEHLEQQQARLEATEQSLVSLESTLAETQTRMTQMAQVLDAQTEAANRLRVLETTVTGLGAKVESLRAASLRAAKANEALYVEFQDQFRGAKSDIRNRLNVYLPLLQENRLGTEEMPALDVGCGRGEWLELLRDQGMVARGIDQNSVMCELCQSNGLDVQAGTVPECLAKIPDASIGLLTGFHIIEHIPYSDVVQLIESAHRVLKPGGAVIFETPNPENLLVGSRLFYLDPTHRNPIPPPLAQFLVEAGGFQRVSIVRLNALPTDVRLHEDGSEVVNRFNDLLYGPQDFAVIGWKD